MHRSCSRFLNALFSHVQAGMPRHGTCLTWYVQHEDLHKEGEGGEEEDGAEEEVGHPLLVPPGPLNQEEEVVESGHDGVLSSPSPLRRMRGQENSRSGRRLFTREVTKTASENVRSKESRPNSINETEGDRSRPEEIVAFRSRRRRREYWGTLTLQ